jgi:hypothetical protein
MKINWLNWKPKEGSVGFDGPAPAVCSIARVPETDTHRTSTPTPNEIIEKTTDHQPSKPTELGFVGREGTPPTHCSNLEALDGGQPRKASPSNAIPNGAILLAPKLGYGDPQKAIPSCWCCAIPYKLEEVKEHREVIYAILGPNCSCLEEKQCLSETKPFCGLCLSHCQCSWRREQENG